MGTLHGGQDSRGHSRDVSEDQCLERAGHSSIITNYVPMNPSPSLLYFITAQSLANARPCAVTELVCAERGTGRAGFSLDQAVLECGPVVTSSRRVHVLESSQWSLTLCDTLLHIQAPAHTGVRVISASDAS